MSDLLNPKLLVRRITYHRWGPDPKRVVMVAVYKEGDTLVARVLGAENSTVVELERAEGVTIRRRSPVALQLADGTTWSLPTPGCSCQVPGPLRGLNPLKVP